MAVKTHYWIGRSKADAFVYCYIRKNACSAFKRLLRAQSPHADAAGSKRLLRFMGTYHTVWPRELEHNEQRKIVVLREPASRALSGYLNRCIVLQEKSTLRRISHTLSLNPGDITFQDFVRYLRRDLTSELNCHFTPQHWSLLPLAYTALDIRSLEQGMAPIIGEDEVAKYFRAKTNETGHSPAADIADAWRIGAGSLRQQYLSAKAFPPSGSFLTPEITRELQLTFAKDLELYRAVEGRVSSQIDLREDAIIRQRREGAKGRRRRVSADSEV